MIRLDGNSLAAFRGAGVAGTVQSVAGCELFGAARMPSWASPYSAAATAALKAQFPTQWPTIRDYGFSHPALVPFINEDPMLVYSLIDGLGKIRLLVGDGVASIITDLQPFQGVKYSTKVKFYTKTVPGSTSSYSSICGWRNGTNSNCYLYIAEAGTFASYGTTSETNTGSLTLPLNTILDFSFENGTAKLGSTTKTWSRSTGGFTNQSNFKIFGVSNTNANAQMYGEISDIPVQNNSNENVAYFAPCKHNGEWGMLDVVALKWWGNSNTEGSFTISESPA